MKIMFLDESGDHNLVKIDEQFPVFCLAGCIFDEVDYKTESTVKINELKIKYFNTSDVIFHSSEIRKCRPPFNLLLNRVTRESFYMDLDNLIFELPFTIIASVIIKNKLKNKYADPANPYTLSLRFIMERFLHYLEGENDSGYISVESRDPKSNNDLLKTFTDIINNGSGHISPTRFQKKILKIDFVTKRKNENGHQIADLVAYPTAKYGLDNSKLNPAFDILKNKFMKHRGEVFGHGCKIFPK